MKMTVYADNAATTMLSERAMTSMLPWLNGEFGNASQPYSFSRKPRHALATARQTIANCIGAFPDEIFFTSGGTEGDNWVIKNACLLNNQKTGIVTSPIEHHAILNACLFEENFRQRTIKYIPVTGDGEVLPSVLDESISRSDGLISIMLLNNEIGTIEPIRELSSVAHNHGCFFHTDAVQAVGHLRIDVHQLGVDYLSASAHKFNGPKGIGFLYVKNGIKIPGLINGGAQENNLRAGTENIASIVGMAEALQENTESIDMNSRKILSLEKRLLSSLTLNGLDFIRNGSKCCKPGIMSLSFRNKDGEALMHSLDLLGISISTGSACDSQNKQVSHVLKAIKLDDNYAKGTIRISLGKNNTDEDIDLISSALTRFVNL